MFRASSCPSSGATTTAVAASGLPSELGDSSAVGCGRAGRPDHNQQHMTHDIKEWFETNLLSLNLEKTHYMQFMAKNNPPNDFDIMHERKKFPWLKLQNSLD
jgi:hypothetical protein